MSTIKIFVASAGDLHDERNRVENTVSKLKISHPHLSFESIKWEKDIEKGRYDGYVQDRINQELLKCDILLLLINKRFGNFSINEYSLAVKSNIKIFVLFKKNPSISGEEDIEELAKVFRFKKELLKENKTLIEEFETDDQLEIQIRDNLDHFLKNNYPYNTPNHSAPENRPVLTNPNYFGINLMQSIADLFASHKRQFATIIASIVFLLLLFDFIHYLNAYKNMVRIPSGKYHVGRPTLDSHFLEVLYQNRTMLRYAAQVHNVNDTIIPLNQGYFISKYEVTNKQYRQFLDFLKMRGKDIQPYKSYYQSLIETDSSNISDYKYLLNDDLPVIGVSYQNAVAYAKWKNMDLPTSQQWEIAARQPDDSLTLYPWGNDFSEGICLTWEKKCLYPEPVNSDKIGIFNGIYGLIGNADEWTRAMDSDSGVLMGGGFSHPGSLQGIIHNKRKLNINLYTQGHAYHSYGIRLVFNGSDSTMINPQSMVYIHPGRYKIGYKITSPLLIYLKDILKSSYNLNQLLFDYPEGTVKLFNAFYIDKYEVSSSEYDNFLEYLQSRPDKNTTEINFDIPAEYKSDQPIFNPDMPAVDKNWFAAKAFASWKGKALPSYEQFSIAISGPSGNYLPWGNQWSSSCCNDINLETKQLLPVRTKLYNRNSRTSNVSWCGAYNLVGNVSEWLSDNELQTAKHMGCSYGEDCRAFGLNWISTSDLKTSYSEYIGFRCVKKAPARITWMIYERLFASLIFK
jgi:formylglycine-generating enzyme required for sulfatase activity